jgi:hypothetical protein
MGVAKGVASSVAGGGAASVADNKGCAGCRLHG